MSWSIVRSTSTSTPCLRMIEALTSMSPSVLEISGERLSVPLMYIALRPVKSQFCSVSAMAGTLPSNRRWRNVAAPGNALLVALLVESVARASPSVRVTSSGYLGQRPESRNETDEVGGREDCQGAAPGLRYFVNEQSQPLGLDPGRPLSRMPLRHGLGRDPHRRVE